jgi:hypothetical protein
MGNWFGFFKSEPEKQKNRYHNQKRNINIWKIKQRYDEHTKDERNSIALQLGLESESNLQDKLDKIDSQLKYLHTQIDIQNKLKNKTNEKFIPEYYAHLKMEIDLENKKKTEINKKIQIVKEKINNNISNKSNQNNQNNCNEGICTTLYKYLFKGGTRKNGKRKRGTRKR